MTERQGTLTLAEVTTLMLEQDRSARAGKANCTDHCPVANLLAHVLYPQALGVQVEPSYSTVHLPGDVTLFFEHDDGLGAFIVAIDNAGYPYTTHTWQSALEILAGQFGDVPGCTIIDADDIRCNIEHDDDGLRLLYDYYIEQHTPGKYAAGDWDEWIRHNGTDMRLAHFNAMRVDAWFRGEWSYIYIYPSVEVDGHTITGPGLSGLEDDDGIENAFEELKGELIEQLRRDGYLVINE